MPKEAVRLQLSRRKQFKRNLPLLKALLFHLWTNRFLLWKRCLQWKKKFPLWKKRCLQWNKKFPQWKQKCHLWKKRFLQLRKRQLSLKRKLYQKVHQGQSKLHLMICLQWKDHYLRDLQKNQYLKSQ
jgi:hypothetical protein